MKQIFSIGARILPAAALLAAAAVCAWAQAPQISSPPADPAGRGSVLVELFTSEGCPHCPEADAMLEKLYTDQSVEGAQIVALEEHVDYWDRPSWVDHYSSPTFTQRQQGYADAMDLDSLYTPQMVVNGLVEFVGNNAPRARSTISALGRAPLPAVRIVLAAAGADRKLAPGARRVRLEARDLPHESASDVYLVLAEDKLFSRVNGGRNAGESWPHSSIAHRLYLVGKMPAGSKEISLIAEIEPPEAAWRVENLRLVAFVQEQETRRVLALGTVRLADLSPQASGGAWPAAGPGAPHAAGAVPKLAARSSNAVQWAASGSAPRVPAGFPEGGSRP